MIDDDLVAPVARLLELGEPACARYYAWPDYRAYGLGQEHIPALISIAVDHDLLSLEDEHDPRAWAPVHAWRALGQLEAHEAIWPLIQLFHQIKDNDWMIEELPDVFALIGPVAFPTLSGYLRDTSYPPYSRMVAATSLMQMALNHPAQRQAAVDALAEQLADFEQNSPGINGVLIANLLELNAAERTELIQQVFAEGKVDRFIAGDWRDAKKRLRARTAQPTTHTLKPDISLTPPDPGN
jgi:hypothetical protein